MFRLYTNSSDELGRLKSDALLLLQYDESSEDEEYVANIQCTGIKRDGGGRLPSNFQIVHEGPSAV